MFCSTRITVRVPADSNPTALSNRIFARVVQLSSLKTSQKKTLAKLLSEHTFLALVAWASSRFRSPGKSMCEAARCRCEGSVEPVLPLQAAALVAMAAWADVAQVKCLGPFIETRDSEQLNRSPKPPPAVEALCLEAYICIYIYIYIHTYIHINKYIYIYIYIYLFIFIFIFILIFILIFIFIFIYLFIFLGG